MAPLPEEIRKSIRKDHWTVSPDPEEHTRRSIYLFVRRNLRYPFLEVFDRPDTQASCSRRDRTTIAPQSLALLNSDLAVTAAAALARRSEAEAGVGGRVERAYRLALGRRPTPWERELARQFVARETARLSGSAERVEPAETGSAATADTTAFHAFCLALLNTNEFIYVD